MDPKLKPALDEIRAVLKKHDVAGLVILGSTDHTDYVLELETTWSCIVREGPLALRFRSKRKDYPSKEAQKKVLEDSVGAVMGIIEVARSTGFALDGLVSALREKMYIEHTSTREPD